MTALDVLPSERFECIYNSVDLSRVSESADRAAAFRRRYGIAANRKVIVQVSWLIPEKGLPDLLEATRQLLTKEQNVQLVLVGDGSHREEYEKLGAELGIDGHVTWAGLIQDPFAEGVYDAADILCQVSRWQEAFGWVLAEAMAYKKPVVGTKVGGIPEIIQDGKTGYLVDPGNPSQLAEKLFQLLQNDALRREMGEAGCERVKTTFNLQKNVARVIELYGISSPDVSSRG
jgi:glycosyltransferase involved in cell wall biosynthesis